jgi:hypothetical protein
MPNWCNNFTSFKGSSDKIEALTNAINKAAYTEERYKEGQAIHSENVKKGYFFFIVKDEPNEIADGTEFSIRYMTKWSPNLEDLAILCKEYGLDAETEFDEDSCEVYGTAKVYSDGTYNVTYVEQEFLDVIEWSEEDELYYYNGEEYEVKQEIIDFEYSKWLESKNN